MGFTVTLIPVRSFVTGHPSATTAGELQEERACRVYQHWRRYMNLDATEKFYSINNRLFHKYLWIPISCGGTTARDSRLIEGLAISDYQVRAGMHALDALGLNQYSDGSVVRDASHAVKHTLRNSPGGLVLQEPESPNEGGATISHCYKL